MFLELDTETRHRLLTERKELLIERQDLAEYVMEIPLPLAPEYKTVYGFQVRVVDGCEPRIVKDKSMTHQQRAQDYFLGSFNR